MKRNLESGFEDTTPNKKIHLHCDDIPTLSDTLTDVIIYTYFEYLPFTDKLSFRLTNKKIYQVSQNIEQLSLKEPFHEFINEYEEYEKPDLLAAISANLYARCRVIELSKEKSMFDYHDLAVKLAENNLVTLLTLSKGRVGEYCCLNASFGIGLIHVFYNEISVDGANFEIELLCSCTEQVGNMKPGLMYHVLGSKDNEQGGVYSAHHDAISAIMSQISEIPHSRALTQVLQIIAGSTSYFIPTEKFQDCSCTFRNTSDNQLSLLPQWLEFSGAFDKTTWNDTSLIDILLMHLCDLYNNCEYMRSEVLEHFEEVFVRRNSDELLRLLHRVYSVYGWCDEICYGSYTLRSEFKIYLDEKTLATFSLESDNQNDGKAVRVTLRSGDVKFFEQSDSGIISMYPQELQSEAKQLNTTEGMLLAFLMAVGFTVRANLFSLQDRHSFVRSCECCNRVAQSIIDHILDISELYEEDIPSVKVLNDNEAALVLSSFDPYTAFYDEIIIDEEDEEIDDEYVDREELINDYMDYKDEVLEQKKKEWTEWMRVDSEEQEKHVQLISFIGTNEAKQELKEKLFNRVHYMGVVYERRDYIRRNIGQILVGDILTLNCQSETGDCISFIDISYESKKLMSVGSIITVKKTVLDAVRNELNINSNIVSDAQLVNAIAMAIPFISKHTLYFSGIVYK